MIQAIDLLLAVHQRILTVLGHLLLLLFLSHSRSIIFRKAIGTSSNERRILTRCKLLLISKTIQSVLACLRVMVRLRNFLVRML